MREQKVGATGIEMEETTKEVLNARVDKVSYAMTIVTHHKDGKSIIYRRHKTAPRKPYVPFNVNACGVKERLSLGLGLMLNGWDATQVALYVALPIQSFRKG